jgi:hypothetical protein
MRAPEKQDFKLGEWLFPKGDLIFLSSRTAAYNKHLWNESSGKDPHPVDQFWSDRFIVYPEDPTSGPLKNPTYTAENEPAMKSRFSIDSLAVVGPPLEEGEDVSWTILC